MPGMPGVGGGAPSRGTARKPLKGKQIQSRTESESEREKSHWNWNDWHSVDSTEDRSTTYIYAHQLRLFQLTLR
jgi:hypothetical protein